MKPRKPNFGVEEVRFLLSEIKERSNVLFGPLSSRLTSQDKKRQWLEIANELGKYGWVRREWEDLRKKWQDLQALTKEKHRKRSKTGEGSVNWTPVDDLVIEVLGSDNPKLVAIPGGLDTSCRPCRLRRAIGAIARLKFFRGAQKNAPLAVNEE